MPSYAVVGATGNVGQALLKILLQTPDHDIHAYCRSKQKLLRLMPELSNEKRVEIFDGDLSADVLARCMQDTRAAFLAIAQSGNKPGTRVSRDLARHVVEALEQLRGAGRGPRRLPRLVVLSSASMEQRLMARVPAVLRHVLYYALRNVYDDMRAGERQLRARDDLVDATWVRPGALTHDDQKGHALSLDEAHSPISYLDLAAGMVEIADEPTTRFAMKGVAVNATAADVRFPWAAPWNIFFGLLFSLLPWTYRYFG